MNKVLWEQKGREGVIQPQGEEEFLRPSYIKWRRAEDTEVEDTEG